MGIGSWLSQGRAGGSARHFLTCTRVARFPLGCPIRPHDPNMWCVHRDSRVLAAPDERSIDAYEYVSVFALFTVLLFASLSFIAVILHDTAFFIFYLVR